MKHSRHWLWLLLLPLVAAGLWRLEFKTKVLDLLPGEEPVVRGLDLYQEHFAAGRELMITLQSTDAEKTAAMAEGIAQHLRAATNLVAHAWWQIPWNESPTQAGEILAWLRMSDSPALFESMAHGLADENLPPILAATKETLATSLSPTDLALGGFDPYRLVKLPDFSSMQQIAPVSGGGGMFASSDGRFRVVYVSAARDLPDYRACTQWCGEIEEILQSLRSSHPEWSDVTLRYTGRPQFEMEISRDMRRDIKGSILGTALIIGLLFWIAHRRWIPLLWLLTLLGLILVTTLALGSLILGPINIISMGFAAILLGLAVDYALVHYQEALAHPTATIPEIRRAIAPSILWAAATTISAFLVLNLCGLPGLAQLGSLVAIGVSLSAIVMVLVYLPPLFRDRASRPAAIGVMPPNTETTSSPHFTGNPKLRLLTLLLASTALGIVYLKPPAIDRTANALRPTHSEASNALAEMRRQLKLEEEPLWVILTGKNERQIFDNLKRADTALAVARRNGVISRYLLPTALWPNPDHWTSNTPTAKGVGARFETMRNAALREGFTEDSMDLTREMLAAFSRFGQSTNIAWPTAPASRWLLDFFTVRTTNQWLVMGLAYSTPGTRNLNAATVLPGTGDGTILVTGWELLGDRMISRAEQHMWRVLVPMALLVFATLLLAFRSVVEIALGIGVLLTSGLILLSVMSLTGWSWNLFNLMALPLILGTGVDYSIFMQLALRRHRGNLTAVHRSVGRALLLCGATAVAGFGSLAWAGNEGLSSFGRVCAVGILANMLISVCLLPAWWTRFKRETTPENHACHR
jgi:predicted RND superfamily exporter protein